MNTPEQIEFMTLHQRRLDAFSDPLRQACFDLIWKLHELDKFVSDNPGMFDAVYDSDVKADISNDRELIDAVVDAMLATDRTRSRASMEGEIEQRGKDFLPPPPIG